MSKVMSKVTVIYHGGNCRDGFAAAWLLRKCYPEADFIPCQYGNPVPEIERGTFVFIVDFSFPMEDLLGIAEISEGVLVLDHHETAAKQLGISSNNQKFIKGNLSIHYDNSTSGAFMTWDHLYLSGVNQPFVGDTRPFVDYIQDRDLWRFRLRGSKEINWAIRSYPLDFDVWDREFSEANLDQLANEGRAICRMIGEIVESHCKHYHRIDIAGFKGIKAVNSTYSILNSEIGEKLSECEPFAVIYFDVPGYRIFQLRSQAHGENVGEIASKMGGGGHRNAASFKIPNAMLPSAS